MDTSTIGFRVYPAPSQPGDLFVHFVAPSNAMAYGSLAEYVQHVLDEDTVNDLSIVRDFNAEWGGRIYLDTAPAADHTVHVFDLFNRVVMILDTYDGPKPELDARVTFSAEDFVKRYDK